MTGPSAATAPAAIFAMFACTSPAALRIRVRASVAMGTRSIWIPIERRSSLGRAISCPISALVGGAADTTTLSEVASAKTSSAMITSTGIAPSTQTRTTARRRAMPRRASASIGASASVARSQPAIRAAIRALCALTSAAICASPAPIRSTAALASAAHASAWTIGGHARGLPSGGRFIGSG